MRKIHFILSIIPFALTGCNKKGGGITLLKNLDLLTNENVSNENLFCNYEKNYYQDLMDTHLPFLVYFTMGDSCSACKNFTPIIEKYVRICGDFVLKVGPNDIEDFKENFGEYFFDKNEKNKYEISYPMVFITESTNRANEIDYNKYMKTKSAFNRYLTKIKKESDIYFTNDSVLEKQIKKDYTYVCFNAKNEESKTTYDSRFVEKIIRTNKTVVVSTNTEYSFVQSYRVSNSIIKASDIADMTTSDEAIDVFF